MSQPKFHMYVPEWLAVLMGEPERRVCQQRDVNILYADENLHRDPRRVEVRSKSIGESFFFDPTTRSIIG